MMVRKLFYPLFLILLSLPVLCQELRSQELLVLKLKDQPELPVGLSAIRRIGFGDGSLQLFYKNGDEFSYGLAQIEKIFFDLSATGIATSPADAGAAVQIYPNPARDVVYIHTGMEDDAIVNILTADGKPVGRFENVSHATPIPVGSLLPGLYLVKVNNQVLKLNKR